MGDLIVLIIRKLEEITSGHWLKLFVISLIKKNSYYKASFTPSDEEALRTYGKLFSFAPALYFEGLKYNSNEQEVLSAVIQILKAITLWKYRNVYPKGIDLKTFAGIHKKQNEAGFLKYNKWEESEDTSSSHSLKIKNCYFYNAFKRYGVPGLTLAFCEADEEYFSTFSRKISFNRGERDESTIARGGDYCMFNFNRDSDILQ